MESFNYRPVTEAYAREEQISLGKAEENISLIELDGEPVSLYYDRLRSTQKLNRGYVLTTDEREHLIERILIEHGVADDIYSAVVLMKTAAYAGSSDEFIEPSPTMFAGEKPAFHELLSRLADMGSLWADDPNDFTVGLVFKATKGIVVLKFGSESLYEADEFDEEFEFKHQLELYPEDAIDHIDWDIH